MQPGLGRNQAMLANRGAPQHGMNLTATAQQRSSGPLGHLQHPLGPHHHGQPLHGLPLQDGLHAPAHLPPAGAGRALLDALDRFLRAPRGKFALALHLSLLKTPALLPVHTRIALALMQDAAQRLGGQVFPMRNADLVLLVGGQEGTGTPGPPAPFPLPDALRDLFGASAPAFSLTTIWMLERDADALQTYVALCEAEPAAFDGSRDEPTPSHGLAALEARLRATDPRTLLVQQTAVQLRPGRGLPLSARLSPVFRELIATPQSPRTEADPDPQTSLVADAAIHRHLAAGLQARILALLLADLTTQGPLTRPARLAGIPIHVNLAPPAIVGPDFARLAQAAAAAGSRFAVEITAADAAADPALTEFAARVLAQARFPLVLDGLVHDGLILIRPDALPLAWVKLAWSPRLADGPPSALARIDAAIAAIGPGRIVLQNADGEAAMVWGQSRGLNTFQGPYLDAVQAASRIAICHSARACTLRQCTNRALALSPALRLGCGNPALLDMGASFDAGMPPA